MCLNYIENIYRYRFDSSILIKILGYILNIMSKKEINTKTESITLQESIKNCKISDEYRLNDVMKSKAIDTISRAILKFTKEVDIATYITEEFMNIYNTKDWNCFVSKSDFGCHTYRYNSVKLEIGKYTIQLFSTKK